MEDSLPRWNGGRGAVIIRARNDLWPVETCTALPDLQSFWPCWFPSLALVAHLERSWLTAAVDDLGPTPLGELRRRGLAVERREAVSRATL
jgi:hypothetical protein